MPFALPPAVARRQWQIMAAFGILTTAVYTAYSSTNLGSASLVLLGVLTVAACYVGPRSWGAQPPRAWRLMALAALLFLIGLVIRPSVTDMPMPMPLLADLASFSGYLLLGIFLFMLLRARESLERHAVLDGLIVFVAAGLTSTLLLAAPAAAFPDRPALLSIIQATYPLLDVVLALLVINLAFTTNIWPVSMIALLVMMVGLFIGDTAYAIVGVKGHIYASPLLNLPYVPAYTALGVAALHPSVVEMSHADRPPVQAWSWQRLAVLLPALLVPFALLLTTRAGTASQRLLIAIGGALMDVLLIARAASAVHGQVAAQLHFEHQAAHDPLTSLPNRQSIGLAIERLVAAVDPEGPERVWVYLLDLDGFKWVNDSWGHDAGDELVMEVARRLRATAPESVPVARVGGDEFLLAYVGDKAGALRMVDDIRSCFVRALPVRETEVVITASIGIAHASGDLERATLTAEALMRDADTAMYRAKREGPGRSTMFDTSMHDQARQRIELEVALRQALGQNQLHVVYQPLVRLETGMPVGAEALVRWEHPERGSIPPGLFIPIAEDSGLISQIGGFVRAEALRQLGEWRSQGIVSDSFYMSVNVSPRQLNEPELPLVISGELARYNIPPQCVALEMTESVMVDGSSVTAQVLFELRQLGAKLLVDDFGTGFSSLGYLRRFPVTGVKIDRSFVTGLGKNEQDDEIVRAVVAMSHALGLFVIAEGVETPLQRDALFHLGVVNGQGWLWGKAVPPGEFAEHWHLTATLPDVPPIAAVTESRQHHHSSAGE
ncbi:putative bifunctional diguanylate cyclase/phosphodiesterase [Actinoplanes regularis]|uniref:putative bifunctional diguanylate cyclase/phosphodiesterase n=1 Tax=Actinoplanes regularis TaxID=52697 RepID=UPI0025538EAC|nr:EAL domain-containing protein [Actinoplanes regularis]GLW28128.1 hypothetical protein Areg01_10680 [Actinoplanes regularis]